LALPNVPVPVIWIGVALEKSVAGLFGSPLYHPRMWPVACAVISHSPLWSPVIV